MKQQIFDILNAWGTNWQFSDLKVKLSPHTPAMDIKTIDKEEKGWIVKWNNGYGLASLPLEEINHTETLATIYQRLKILTNGSQVANTKS